MSLKSELCSLLDPAVFFHPALAAGASNQLTLLPNENLNWILQTCDSFSRQQTSRCLNSDTRVGWYSCCLQEIFFTAAQFLLGLRLTYSEKSSYSQPGGKLASKGVISDSSVQFWWNIIPVEWQEYANWWIQDFGLKPLHYWVFQVKSLFDRLSIYF